MNYKLPFWILIAITIGISIYFWFIKVSLEVDLGITENNVVYLESDIYIIDELIKSNGSEKKIDSILYEYSVSDYFIKAEDTIFLNRTFLVLKNDSIIRVGIQK